MRCRENLQAYLQENNVPFEVHQHDRVYTAQELAASEHVPGRVVAKVVMAVADGKLVMLVLPATERVFVPELASVLGAKHVRLAWEPEFASVFANCQVGAMPPFGNLYGVPVYVDSTLGANEMIYFQAGTHTDTMSMRYEDYVRLVEPIVAAFSLEEALLLG